MKMLVIEFIFGTFAIWEGFAVAGYGLSRLGIEQRGRLQ